MVRVFVNDENIAKTQKMAFDAALHNTQYYKVRIKGKWGNPGKGVMFSRHLIVVAIEKGAFGSPSIRSGNLFLCIYPTPLHE